MEIVGHKGSWMQREQVQQSLENEDGTRKRHCTEPVERGVLECVVVLSFGTVLCP